MGTQWIRSATPRSYASSKAPVARYPCPWQSCAVGWHPSCGVRERNPDMNLITPFALAFGLVAAGSANAQTPASAKSRICMDVAHQQKFWRDPADMAGMDVKMIERVKYMTAEFTKSATGANASLSYLKKEISAKDVEGCDLLFIHIPSVKYTLGEVSAISKYVASGGSLFLVMDQDMWSTLEQTNVNDLIRPFGVQFGGESPDSQAGGHTNPGGITDKRLKISYHGARTVTGGTPFAFNDRSDANPFGTFMEVKNGGRIVVMGDGMVSLYMTSWEGVNDYQCQEFMQDVFRWLLK